MKKLMCLTVTLLAAGVLYAGCIDPVPQASAQNVTCATRPSGDSSNACASTAFVQGAVGASGFVPVTNYGAVCDGVTDDTAAIQKAFASGNSIIFNSRTPCGVSSPVVLTRDNQAVTGIGDSSGLKALNATTNLLGVPNGITGNRISNMSFLCAATTEAVQQTAIILNSNASGTAPNGGIQADSRYVVEGVTIDGTIHGTNGCNIGINSGGAENIQILSNRFLGLYGTTDGHGYGLLLVASNNSRVIANICDPGVAGQGRHCIYTSITGNSLIAFNKCYNFDSNCYPGNTIIALALSGDQWIGNTSIDSGTTLVSPAIQVGAFEITGGGSVESGANIVIADNVISNPGRDCISINKASIITIVGNTCTNPGTTTSGQGSAGIRVVGSAIVTISANPIWSALTDATVDFVNVDATSSVVNVNGNNFQGNTFNYCLNNDVASTKVSYTSNICVAATANTAEVANPAVSGSTIVTGYGAGPIAFSAIGLRGSTSGTLQQKAAAVAGSNTITWPAGTTDFSATGGTSQVIKQTSTGAAFTVARLACSDLSDATSGCNGGGVPATGTSGGIPYYNTTTSLASSALLGANRIVLGGGAGTAPATLGSLGTTTTVLHGNAGGAPTFGSVVSADLSITTTSCTNQFVTAISSGAVGTCSTATLASAQFANQGTTTTVLHGNASGNPSFGAVSLTADITGVLGLANGGSAKNITAVAGAVVWTDADSMELTAAGSSGQLLQSTGTTAPTWITAACSTLSNPTGCAINIAARGGGFDIWQRLINGATTITQAASLTAYVNDSWYLITNANQASTVTRAAGIATGSLYAATVQRNSGQTGTGVMRYAMPLNSGELVAAQGRNIALSFTVSAGANWSPSSGTLTYIVYCGTGSPGKRGASSYTGETTPISSSVNLTPGGAAQRVTAVSSSTVASNCTQMEIQFNWTPVGTASTADTVTVDDLQLEVVASSSSSASPYAFITERDQYQKSLYYLFVFNPQATKSVGMGLSSSATLTSIILQFPTAMRSAPTLVTPTAGNFTALDGSLGSHACTNLTLNNATTLTATLDCTVTSGLTAGNAGFMLVNSTGSLIFPAEL